MMTFQRGTPEDSSSLLGHRYGVEFFSWYGDTLPSAA